MQFLIRQWLPLRDRLHRLQVIPLEQNLCPLCNDIEETFSHLVLHCNHVNSLWYQVAGKWDVSFVCLGKFSALFDDWFNADISSRSIQPWRLACFVLLWMIWIVRNRVVFKNSAIDNQVCYLMFSFHLAWWSRIAQGGSVPLLSDIYRALAKVTLVSHTVATRLNSSWNPPSLDIMKINVNRSFSLSTLASGMERCLGITMGTFSFSSLNMFKPIQPFTQRYRP